MSPIGPSAVSCGGEGDPRFLKTSASSFVSADRESCSCEVHRRWSSGSGAELSCVGAAGGGCVGVGAAGSSSSVVVCVSAELSSCRV